MTLPSILVFKGLCKAYIIFFCSLSRVSVATPVGAEPMSTGHRAPFHMILMRAASCLFVKMPLHKHLIYVLIRVPLTGLVNSICLRSASVGSKPRSTGPCEPFSKCHRSNTRILRYYYSPFMTYAD